MSLDVATVGRLGGGFRKQKAWVFLDRVGALSGKLTACSEPEKSFLPTPYYCFHAAGSLVQNIA